MPEVGKFYTFKYNEDYSVFVHAVFYTNTNGGLYMAFEDYEGDLQIEEVIDFEDYWVVANGY